MLDRTEVVNRSDTLAVRVAGVSATVAVFDFGVSPDSIVSTVVAFARDSLVQHVVAILDPGSLRTREVRDSMRGEQVHLTYAGNRVRGTRLTRDSVGHTDTVALNLRSDSNSVDRRTLPALVACLSLSPGRAFTLPVFDSWTLHTAAVRLFVSGRTTLAMAGRSLDAYRIDVTGDLWMLPETFYISAYAPRRILRIERPRERLVLEVTNEMSRR